MEERHPAAVLLGAALAGVLVHLAGAAAVAVVARAGDEGWQPARELATAAAAAGLGLGLALGLAELAARRGRAAGALALLAGGLLPGTFSAYALLRATAPGELQAIDVLRQALLEPELWRGQALVVTLTAALLGPLLVARARERPCGAQALASFLGGALAIAVLLAALAREPAGGAPLWGYVLPPAVTAGLLAPALLRTDRAADAAVRRLRGLPARGDGRAPAGPDRRPAITALVALGAVGWLAARHPCERADVTLRRLHALSGPAGRLALVRALLAPASGPPLPGLLLGASGALERFAPLPPDPADGAVEATALLRHLVAEAHVPAIEEAAAWGDAFPPAALIHAARRAAGAGEDGAERLLGQLLVRAGQAAEGEAWLERAAARDDPRALLALADRREDLPERARLLRRCLELPAAGDDERTRAACDLERLFDEAPRLRSVLDDRRPLRVVDAAGRPLAGGVVAVNLLGPVWDLGAPATSAGYVRREVQAGEALGGLLADAALDARAAWSRDSARSRAWIVDGQGRVEVGHDGALRVVVTHVPPSACRPITGVVLGRAGVPAPGATVQLCAWPLAPGVQARGLEVRAGPDGRFVFEDVPPGSYGVAAPGQGEQAPVAPGDDVRVTRDPLSTGDEELDLFDRPLAWMCSQARRAWLGELSPRKASRAR